MEKNKYNKLLKECLKTWGNQSQMDMLIEEMAELTVELQHIKRNRGNWEKVMKEYVDVYITLKQLKFIIKNQGITKEMLESREKRKMNDLLSIYLNYLSSKEDK